MKLINLLLVSLIFVSCANVELSKKDITYRTAKTKMKGYVAYDKNQEGKRPGVLVVHEWWGHNEHARKAADRLAEMGYAALAVDMYGDGKTADHPKDAMGFMKKTLGDAKEANLRFQAALATLKQHPMVDSEKIAAIGYCFGGGVVLAQARRGTDLDAVVSFHGSLGTDKRMRKGKFDGTILVLNGEADPMVPEKDIKAIAAEMKAAGVDYRYKGYAGAKHAFTNPAATEKGKKYGLPLAYDKAADEDSWKQMTKLFEEIF